MSDSLLPSKNKRHKTSTSSPSDGSNSNDHDKHHQDSNNTRNNPDNKPLDTAFLNTSSFLNRMTPYQYDQAVQILRQNNSAILQHLPKPELYSSSRLHLNRNSSYGGPSHSSNTERAPDHLMDYLVQHKGQLGEPCHVADDKEHRNTILVLEQKLSSSFMSPNSAVGPCKRERSRSPSSSRLASSNHYSPPDQPAIDLSRSDSLDHSSSHGSSPPPSSKSRARSRTGSKPPLQLQPLQPSASKNDKNTVDQKQHASLTRTSSYVVDPDRKRELERRRRDVVLTSFRQLDKLVGVTEPGRRFDKEAVIQAAISLITSHNSVVAELKAELVTCKKELEEFRSEKAELRKDKAYMRDELHNAKEEIQKLRVDNLILWQHCKKINIMPSGASGSGGGSGTITKHGQQAQQAQKAPQGPKRAQGTQPQTQPQTQPPLRADYQTSQQKLGSSWEPEKLPQLPSYPPSSYPPASQSHISLHLPPHYEQITDSCNNKNNNNNSSNHAQVGSLSLSLHEHEHDQTHAHISLEEFQSSEKELPPLHLDNEDILNLFGQNVDQEHLGTLLGELIYNNGASNMDSDGGDHQREP